MRAPAKVRAKALSQLRRKPWLASRVDAARVHCGDRRSFGPVLMSGLNVAPGNSTRHLERFDTTTWQKNPKTQPPLQQQERNRPSGKKSSARRKKSGSCRTDWSVSK